MLHGSTILCSQLDGPFYTIPDNGGIKLAPYKCLSVQSGCVDCSSVYISVTPQCSRHNVPLSFRLFSFDGSTGRAPSREKRPCWDEAKTGQDDQMVENTTASYQHPFGHLAVASAAGRTGVSADEDDEPGWPNLFSVNCSMRVREDCKWCNLWFKHHHFTVPCVEDCRKFKLILNSKQHMLLWQALKFNLARIKIR